MEEQIKLLQEKVDQGSSTDPSFALASELGSLSVRDIELKKARDELLLVRKQVQDKDALLQDATTEKTRLQNIISSFRQALIETRTSHWDNINREIKKDLEKLGKVDAKTKSRKLTVQQMN